MARSFNGTTDHIDLANEANFDRERTDTYSVALWINPVGGQFGYLFAKEINDATARGFGMYINALNKPLAELINDYGAVNRIDVGYNTGLTVGAWTHLCMTYSGSSTAAGITLYVNGVSVTLVVNLDTLTATILNDNTLKFGWDGSGSFFKGSLAGFGFWNVVLAQADVTQLANGDRPLGVQNASLVAAPEFCGDSGKARDGKGTNDGTLTGTTLVADPPQFDGCSGRKADAKAHLVYLRKNR